MGIFDKLKKKNKSRKNNGRDQRVQKPLEERYGYNSGVIQNNPLYRDEHTQEDEGVEQYNPLYIAEEPGEVNASEEAPLTPKENLLKNIGGMPTRESIIEMAGGLKLEKLGKHKHFAAALDALDSYQTLMGATYTTSVNKEQFYQSSPDQRAAMINVHEDVVQTAYERLVEFAYQTDKAVKEANGLFSRRSSNVQKLAPVFANLLVKAYELLPKLAHLETAVAPYILETDQETYTFSDILNHQVVGGRSGGLATRGPEENSGEIILSPKETAKAIEKVRSKKNPEAMMQLRRDATTKARMGMPIPRLPDRILQDGQGIENNVDQFVEKYVKELRLLQTALDDTAESHELSGETERKGVHDQQAEHFRMSRLIYRVIRNRDTLKMGLMNGFENENVKQMPGYQEVIGLKNFGGKTLLDASAMLNKQARDESTFIGLTDENGNQLQVEDDYKVKGAAASIAILDLKNQRVLRAPKKDSKYLSEKEQQTALNGIKDEAVGKVAQFLGFNVSAQAEAAGFKARDSEGKNETAVFGGSIMELAKGKEAAMVNLLMKSGDEEKIAKYRRKEDYTTLDITKQGRLIGEILKMHVLDYIVMHQDRHGGNFLINTEASSEEAMVTGIDNDMVLGYDNHLVKVGEARSADALNAINDRAILDWSSSLAAAFPMMPQEIKDTLMNLDINALNDLLMPYADRVTRLTVLHRAEELIAWAKKVPTCDLSTQEGVEEFVKELGKSSMADAIKRMTSRRISKSHNELLINPHDLPSIIFMILQSYGMGWNTSGVGLVQVMKLLGLSKEEAKKIMDDNYSRERDYEKNVEAIDEALENYDQL